MRIVIDLQGAQTQSRLRGIGRYSIALAQGIARNAKEHEVWIILNNQFPHVIDQIRASFQGLLAAENILIFEVPKCTSWDNEANYWRREAAEYIRESFIAELRPDIVHITSLFEGANLCDAVLSVGRMKVKYLTSVTLYDLIPMLNPDNYLGVDWIRNWYEDKLQSLMKASVLLSISDYARREAIAALNLSGDNIINISTSHNSEFKPKNLNAAEIKILLAKYKINSKYLMYNGALESRKNLDRLLEAYSILSDKIKDDYKLIFVGRVSEFDHQRLFHLSEQLGVADRFVITGHVPDEDLVALFSCCELFVFPSLHEGFGLPALEAMACGAPTIGSNLTSVPEVIGRQDALFDPHSAKSIAEKIESCIKDTDFLDDLRNHSLRQAANFSWDKTANEAIRVFETNCGEPANNIPDRWSDTLRHRDSTYNELINYIGGIPITTVAPSEDDIVEVSNCIANNRATTDKVMRRHVISEKFTWLIEGQFDSSYSLAIVNREVALALDKMGHDVAMKSTDGGLDLVPSKTFLDRNPRIKELNDKSTVVNRSNADVTSLDIYPPYVDGMKSRFNMLHCYAWEETGFPVEWVNSFNKNLQGIAVISKFTQKVMIDNGVSIPLSVSGVGVDHWLSIDSDQEYRLEAKNFRFLHVSSCFPRKGIDILLKAYGNTFTDSDDVSLVIKTFHNPHNEVLKWLNEFRRLKPNFPDVVLIRGELANSQLKSLYEQCHSLVAPSRGEGFGLPIAEGMLSGLAVITTNWGGQLDFCCEDSAWLVDYSFTSSESHFGLFDSVWAEPNVDDLSGKLLQVFEDDTSNRSRKTAIGVKRLLEKHKWSDVAHRLIQSIKFNSSRWPLPRSNKVGWVTSWNTRCGIANYSQSLINNIALPIHIFAGTTTDLIAQDEGWVTRCWKPGETDNLSELHERVSAAKIDILVLQFNYSFFNLHHLSDFLNKQILNGVVVIIMMHSTVDPVHILPHKKLEEIFDVLGRCSRILVHTVADLNRLKLIGLINNVALFPHGVTDYKSQMKNDSEIVMDHDGGVPLITSYGFFLPHKGLLELIDAVYILKTRGVNINLHMVNAEYPVAESAELIAHAKEKIQKNGLTNQIHMTTKYLNDCESLALISVSALVIFPYQNTGESSSAAVRFGLATGVPVAVTPLEIFDDVKPAVHRLAGTSPLNIADGILEFLNKRKANAPELSNKKTTAQRWRESHQWDILGERMLGILTALSKHPDSEIQGY